MQVINRIFQGNNVLWHFVLNLKELHFDETVTIETGIDYTASAIVYLHVKLILVNNR